MTDEELQAIEDRASKATPGPWSGWEQPATGPGMAAFSPYVDRLLLVTRPNGWKHSDTEYSSMVVAATLKLNPADADFIAHARTDVPALIAEIRRLQADAEVDQLTINRLKREYGEDD